MAPEKEIFSLSGPQYLTTILDWSNASHKRSIVASLVKGVLILEHDHLKNRQGPNALAPPWWESFHFCLIKTLVDSENQSIFGAIFQYKSPNYYCHSTTFSSNQNPPKYVIAFRGTVKKRDSILRDMQFNARVAVDRLQDTSRVHIGLGVVQNIVQNNKVSDILLAGHSLGSSIALMIGRYMAKMEIYLETYLFNPPFISLPIEEINNDMVRFGLRCFQSACRITLAFAVNSMSTTNQQSIDDASFTKLCGWIPYLFVNKSDPICSEYFGYFESLEKMVESGADEFARIMARYSIRSSIGAIMGKESEPSQHLPSANLIVNSSPREYSMKLAHEISQWWTSDLECESKLYQFW